MQEVVILNTTVILTIVFFVSIGLIFYTYFFYPIVLWFFSLFRKSFYKQDLDFSGEYPRISLVFTAYNEEAVIEEKLLSLDKMDYPKEKVDKILVIDRSSDKTEEIARRVIKEKGLNVQIYQGGQRRGKTGILNEVIESGLIKTDIVIFNDAPCIMTPDCAKTLVRELELGPYASVSANFVYRNLNQSSISQNQSLYEAWEIWLRKSETNAKVLFSAMGPCFITRKKYWHVLDPEHDHDCLVPIFGHQDRMPSAQSTRAIAEEILFSNIDQEIRQRRRVVAKDWKAIWANWRFRDLFLHPFVSLAIFSHRFMRWSVFLFMLIALGVNIPLAVTGSLIMQIFLGLQGLFYFLALSGLIFQKAKRSPPRLFSLASHLLVAHYGAFVGIIDGLRNKSFATWNTERE